MGRKDGTRRGYVSIFGRRKGSNLWVSGFISAPAAKSFKAARERLIVLYEEVWGKLPKRVTKPDVVEFLAIGDDEARRLFEEQRAKES